MTITITLTPKQKVAAISGAACLFAVGACVCAGMAWRSAGEAKKKQDAKDAVVKLFPDGKIFTGFPPPPRPTFLQPHEATDLDGVTFKVSGGQHTPDNYFRLDYEITNTSDNKIISCYPWRHGSSAKLTDEFGNTYPIWSTMDSSYSHGFIRRLDPGKSVKGFVSFEGPLGAANLFEVELKGDEASRPGKVIAYKFPRSFFAKQ